LHLLQHVLGTPTPSSLILTYFNHALALQEDELVRIRACYSNHQDIFEELIAEFAKDTDDKRGLKITVLNVFHALLHTKKTAGYKIGSKATGAWVKVAEELQMRLVQHLRNTMTVPNEFCQGSTLRASAPCAFCAHHRAALEKEVTLHLQDQVRKYARPLPPQSTIRKDILCIAACQVFARDDSIC
jgi:hypothetical protein